MIMGKPLTALTGGWLTPQIIITAPAGSTVTCTTPGGVVLTATEVSGTWTFVNLPGLGTYTVNASQESQNKTVGITVDKVASFGVALRFGSPISTLPVGDSVYINVNNAKTEFLVVQQGKPSSIYSTTFENGTILLMKDIYENGQWHNATTNSYENSTLHSYLNNDFLALFDTNVQNAIKQVKVPYRKGSGTSKTVTSGESGLSAKIFLLSMTEVGFSESYQPTNEGAKLSYFESGTGASAKNKRIAEFNGTAANWWLRSPSCAAFSSGGACRVGADGTANNPYCTNSIGVRPALVLPNTTLVDNQHNIIE